MFAQLLRVGPCRTMHLCNNQQKNWMKMQYWTIRNENERIWKFTWITFFHHLVEGFLNKKVLPVSFILNQYVIFVKQCWWFSYENIHEHSVSKTVKVGAEDWGLNFFSTTLADCQKHSNAPTSNWTGRNSDFVWVHIFCKAFRGIVHKFVLLIKFHILHIKGGYCKISFFLPRSSWS